jgi:diaminopimelate epimerase
MADPDAGIAFLKGHGTGNDFVLLPDPDGALELTEARVRTLCDRRSGLGADGVLRVVRSTASGAAGATDAEWFMDYRNADGSIAEMCGNGVRVFARYLFEAGLVGGSEFVVGSRAGPKPVLIESDGEISVGMGEVRSGGTSAATLAGRRFVGLVVDVGNPHLACVTEADIDGLDLETAPRFDATVFPHGVNVEFVSPARDGVIRLRVFERGVGETRSCGTGTVAAAAAALQSGGARTGELEVHVPGGRVRVRVTEHGATLTGPAVLLAKGELTAEWWRAAGTG